MKTSIIICTRNRPDELMRCLESIAAQTRLPDEVVIVDASDDEMPVSRPVDQFSSLRMTVIRSSPSTTRQRNIGIDASQGDVVFFFDDDVILEPDYLDQVVTFYEQDAAQAVGGVHGLITGMEFSWLAHKKRLLYHRLFFLHHNDRTAGLLPSGNCTLLDMAASQTCYAKEPIRVYLMSSCMASFRRQVLQEFRFDEHFAGCAGYEHGEDMDLSHRIAQKYSLFCLPAAHLEHRQSPKHTGWYQTQDYWRVSMYTQIRFFRKHLATHPLNYLALLWSWVGLLLFYGVLRRNDIAWRGIWEGIREILGGAPQRGLLDVG